MLDPESESKEPLPLSDEERVDQLCDEFEAAYRNGQQPRIEDYLEQVSEVARGRLLAEAIALELEWQRDAGTLPDIQAYYDRFPNSLTAVDAAFELADSHVDLADVSTTGPRSEHDTELELETDDEQMPERIGRYLIQKKLGRGGFAVVYLAHDTELDRQVALKVPRPDRFAGDRDIERFVEEARHAAALDHEGIVRIYDVQRDGDSVYIVQQFVAPGRDLAFYADQNKLSSREIAQLMIRIVEPVGFAHQAGFYHRDLKPANILIDEDGGPWVVDFGLAVHVSRQHAHRGEVAGSYPYMAPEQARGKAHRLDGRTDIWALGVIMYELLTRERPFQGTNRAELFDEIEDRDPRPPRQIAPSVPRELSRICLACLAKRATDRYESTTDLIEDLQHWLEPPDMPTPGDFPETIKPPPAKIVPKGLRSFDADDSDFFLELLPGPRDREGLPKSIRFWKQRIEETDSQETFSVGLIYGPSGCGKSSLVRAGLLPRLAKHIVPVYVEATASDTEVRLLKSFRRHWPDLPDEAPLAELFVALRDQAAADDRKVLIVLDQFEQWLHARAADDQSQLVAALRQCDGGHLQAVVLVRDDFYRSVDRFFHALEEQLVGGQNQALVDLFDADHAKKVLTAFGRAYEKLPQTELNDEQRSFLEAAVTGLAEKGEVICVRLAVFAEMMKGRPWTPASLHDVGGTEGVGVTFLEEIFASRNAPPNYRVHAKGECAVLQALLPELGTDIKGQMRSYNQLMDAAANADNRYAGSPTDFDVVLDILNKEVRLITPTEPDKGGDEDTSSSKDSAKHYQLSHDYLVPSLRRWLRQKETESCAGRARLRLVDRAALWQSKPETQQLPPLWEYANILALTRKRDWTAVQRTMMSAAGRYYATRGAALLVLVALLAWGGREVFSRFNADKLVKNLINASPDKVVQSVAEVQPYLPWAQDELQQLAALDAQTDDQRRQRLHAQLALVGEDNGLLNSLLRSLLEATPPYLGVIRVGLSPFRPQISDRLWGILHDESADADQRFRAGLALANYAAASDQWRDEDYPFLVEHLLSENPKDQPEWLRQLTPIASYCVTRLEELFAEADAPETQQLGAANALAEFARDDQQRIANLLRVATPRQYEILYPLIASSPAEGVKTELAQVAKQLPPEDMGSVERVSYGKERAGAAVTLLRLGERERVLPVFDLTDDPEAITQFIHRCRQRRVSAGELLELLRLVVNQPSSNPPRARYALLLALGDYSLDELPVSDRPQLLSDLGDWYANDPSSAVHGAAGWLLRQWGQDDVVQRADQTPVPYSPDREWFTLKIVTRPPVKIKATDSTDNENEQSTAERVNEDAQPPSGAGDPTDESDSDAADAEPTDTGDGTEEAETDSAKDNQSDGEVASDAAEFVPQTFYMTFIVFQPGTYTVGSPGDQPDRNNNERVHEVVLTRPFAILDREVTFAEMIASQQTGAVPYDYQGVIPEYGSSPDTAVIGPDWYDAVRYCRWLTEQLGRSEDEQCYPDPAKLDREEFPLDERAGAPRDWPLRDLAAGGFRLPTEHEWELACRVGNRVSYGFGGDATLLGHYCWCSSNSGKSLHLPKTRRPSLRGLFDMHGNVYEWCHDWYGGYQPDTLTDPLGPSEGSDRVRRGGGWSRDAAYCRSSDRSSDVPSGRGSNLGFRLALSPSSSGCRMLEGTDRSPVLSGSVILTGKHP